MYGDLIAVFNTLAVTQIENFTGALVDTFNPYQAQALWAGGSGAGECLQIDYGNRWGFWVHKFLRYPPRSNGSARDR